MAAESGRRRPPLLLSPRRWPVRWRLAAVSAGLTLVILICVAFVVGRLVSDRLGDDFRTRLAEEGNALAAQLAGLSPDRYPALLSRSPVVQGSAVRLIEGDGDVRDATLGAPSFGPPQSAPSLARAGDWELLTLPIATTETDEPLFLQYAINRSELEATTQRLWLLLAGGVLGGTFLAALAGLAVAGRAMSPVASLTGAARRIASTRDPSLRIPEPESDDEVAELARTLDQMLRELDAARNETEGMIEAQREFVADASHELRTPLTSILANLELLAERIAEDQPSAASEDAERAELVAGALASTRRMRLLVADLLLLARADAGRQGPRHECDLAEIASAALAELRPIAADHELAARIEPAPAVLGNPGELHRVALNLLDNAVRHTPPGTRVELAVCERPGQALLEVSDDGPGVPLALREQIFSRFARGAEPSDLRPDAGTGLGLAIVAAVAESHGGSVRLEASEHGGARFVVTLPAAPPDSEHGGVAPAPGPAAQQPVGGQKPRSTISASS